MKISFLFVMLFSTISLKSEIIINEFMPSPEGDEPEWIEIYNPDNTAYDIPDLRIFDLLNFASCSLYVEPYSYAIITSKPEEFVKYRDVPEGVRVIKASVPGLNNTFDAIVLKDKDGNLFDSAYYDMDYGEKGKSFERINPKLPPLYDNIQISNHPDGATPGFRNSLSPMEYDAGISDILLQDNQILINVINFGEKSIEINLICEIENDIIFEDTFTLIDTLSVGIDAPDNVGLKTVSAYLSAENDYNDDNDSLKKNINFPPGENTIFINEIMFDVDENSSEYIELYNSSNSVINLWNYSLHDEAQLDKSGLIINNDFKIQPNAYALIVWDSLFFNIFSYTSNMENLYFSEKGISLNKTDDIIVLKSSSSVTLDSLHYQNDWHNSSLLNSKNVSLEKISPELNSSKRDNWSSCIDESGGTPAIENSVRLNLVNEDKISIKPNPFSPYDLKGFNECVISYNYDFRDASVTAKIYDRNGAKLRVIKNNYPTFGNGIIKWDGTNDKGYKLQPAPYILIFEIKNNEDDKIYIQKKVIVIGK